MEIICSPESLRISIPGYDSRSIAQRILSAVPDGVFFTDSSTFNADLAHILKKENFSKIYDCSIDLLPFQKMKEDFFRQKITTPELSVKKNMLDLIDDTIYNYLANYWKDFDTVNSEVTDTLFRAKHKLASTIFYEVERDYWDAQNKRILEHLYEHKLGANSLVVSSVERRYWFMDYFSKNMPQF